MIEASQRTRTFITKTFNNPYIQRDDNAKEDKTKQYTGLEKFNGFRRRKGTTIQQEKQRQEKTTIRKRKRAAKLITAEILKQMTLDDYQRKYNKIEQGKINAPWGNTIQETKGRLDCRILFLNVNGLQKANEYAKLFEIGEEAVYNDVDIIGMAETKINWQNQKARRSCECIAK